MQLGLDRVDVSRTPQHSRGAQIPHVPRAVVQHSAAIAAPTHWHGHRTARGHADHHTSPVEAREWLTGNPNDSAFATNRFQTTERALAFVEALYAKGATEVLVDDPGVDASGEPYADTLLVRFPLTGIARWRVQEFCEEEGPGDVPPGDFVMHVGQYEIMLWWD
jgi:hypothetical protein